MKTQSDKENVRITLRLPADLHATLQQLAEQDKRSLNSQIVLLLETAVSQRGK
jgi:hypothetical protein